MGSSTLRTFGTTLLTSISMLVGLAAGPVAAEPPLTDRAVIHFANQGAIRDWRVDHDGALLIRGLNKRWYRATFFGPCDDIRFANRIGFITNPSGSLDKFSAVWVRGQRCRFSSFEETFDPQYR